MYDDSINCPKCTDSDYVMWDVQHNKFYCSNCTHFFFEKKETTICPSCRDNRFVQSVVWLGFGSLWFQCMNCNFIFNANRPIMEHSISERKENDKMSLNSNIAAFSTEQLKKELDRRAEEQFKKDLDQRIQMNEFVVDQVDMLLQLVPEHSRTSCNDVNPVNVDRCTRCVLLGIKRYKYMNCDQFLQIEILNDPLTKKII